MKRRFVKLENNTLIFADMKKIRYNGRLIFNAKDSVYYALGYKLYKPDPFPMEPAKDGFHFVAVYSEDELYLYEKYEEELITSYDSAPVYDK